MNRVILMGRLTRDPEASVASSGNFVYRTRLAIPRRKAGESDFVDCSAFGKTGEFLEKYFKKGDKICVEGSISSGSYTNREGNKVYYTGVIIEHIDFCEGRKDGAGIEEHEEPALNAPEPTANQEGFYDVPEESQEELPFR